MLMRYCAGINTTLPKVLLCPCQNGFFNFTSVSSSLRSHGTLKSYSIYKPVRTLSVTSNCIPMSTANDSANMQNHPQRTYRVVVAATREMGIGKDGKLPWTLPSDLKFFNQLTVTTSDPTKKNAVIMGRKTWESIPTQFRPLPGRLNVVLTRSKSSDIEASENVVICETCLGALKLLAEPHYLLVEKVFVIGGGQVLREALNGPQCDAIHITEIETEIVCDTFIPAIDLSVYEPWYKSTPLVENNVRYCFVTYVRKGRSIESQISHDGITANHNSDSG